MLISQRKEGDVLIIGDGVEIRIISVRKKVVLGIIAPKDVKVTALKLSDVALENTLAAAHTLDFGRTFAGAVSADASCLVLSKAPKDSGK